jgi:hypothetical protein
MLERMTRLLTTLTLLAFPHGGQRTARRNALAAMSAQPVTKSLTASATSTTANSLRSVASG